MTVTGESLLKFGMAVPSGNWNLQGLLAEANRLAVSWQLSTAPTALTMGSLIERSPLLTLACPGIPTQLFIYNALIRLS